MLCTCPRQRRAFELTLGCMGLPLHDVVDDDDYYVTSSCPSEPNSTLRNTKALL